MREIRPLANKTKRTGVISDIGGFGALFDLKAAGFSDPILVTSTDGVGTKLMIAIATGQHSTVGIDLVAMCANDLVVQGAEPLMFLDYFATGNLKVEVGKEIVTGIAEGCRRAGCALIGGETAEMPGMYGDGDYDLAGFCVGAVERDQILTSRTVQSGDIILGLASDGVHSNGFSLVRDVIEISSLGLDDLAPFDATKTLGQVLLQPTRMYVRPCLAAIKAGGVHALAHITGGGLLENLPRVLPNGVKAQINGGNWQASPVFTWLRSTGNIPLSEMYRTFNLGIGMIMVVDEARVELLTHTLTELGESVAVIGQIKDIMDTDSTINISNPDAPFHP